MASNNDTCAIPYYQLQVIAGVRGSVAVLCCAAIIGAICYYCSCVKCRRCPVKFCRNRYIDLKRYEQRLVLYLTSATLLYILMCVVQFGVLGEDSLSTKGLVKLCSVIGFFQQFSSWIHLLSALWVIGWFSYKYYHDSLNTMEQMPTLCKDILPLFIIVVSAAIVSAVPAVSGSYGLTGGWCWIRSINENCDIDKEGVAYQWLLWYGWVTFFLVFIPSLLCTGICRAYIIARTQGAADPNQIAVRQYEERHAYAFRWLLFTYLLYLLVTAYRLAAYIYTSVSQRFTLGVWVAFAVAMPLGAVCLSWSALIYLWHTDQFNDPNGVGERLQ